MTSPASVRATRGFTMVELVVAIGLGLMAIAMGSFLFLGQLRGYRDMDIQARMNTQSKEAVQVMMREISNTGAVLANPREDFLMRSNEIRLSYGDLRGRHCPADQKVTSRFFVSKPSDRSLGDTLVHEVRCNGGEPRRRPLVSGVGEVDLYLRYYDRNGSQTGNAANVKQVDFFVHIFSAKGRTLFDRNRIPFLRVELAN